VLSLKTKGDKTRQVEIIEPAWGLLLAWADAASITEGPIFRPLSPSHSVQERRMSPDTVYRTISLRSKEAKLPRISPHTLRHTHITLALRGGAKLEDVQLWVGHSDPKTTAGYYHAEEFIGNSPARLIDLGWKPKEE
jgi:integrase